MGVVGRDGREAILDGVSHGRCVVYYGSREVYLRDDGMVNANHQDPTRNKTSRNGSVDDTEVFDMANRSRILSIWTKTAAT